MNTTDNSDYSTQKITPQLLGQIIDALKNKAYGSVEIYIENNQVTQITERTITKIRNSTASVTNNPAKTRINRFQLKIQKF
ncbi:MAG: hypothetical protein AAB541_02795 [Patescibacteria group bacterium]